MASLKPSLLFTLTLLLITTPQPSHSFPFTPPYQSLLSHLFSSLPFSSYQTLFSLARSLTLRVANARASRGDLAGAARARSLAHMIRLGIGLGFMWDYMSNCSWRDVGSVSDALGLVSDLNELMGVVNELMEVVTELTRTDSNDERAFWVQRKRLIKVFNRQGPLREVVKMLQKEVVEGELLRDCLELGSDDLKGLIQNFKSSKTLLYSTLLRGAQK